MLPMRILSMRRTTPPPQLAFGMAHFGAILHYYADFTRRQPAFSIDDALPARRHILRAPIMLLADELHACDAMRDDAPAASIYFRDGRYAHDAIAAAFPITQSAAILARHRLPKARSHMMLQYAASLHARAGQSARCAAAATISRRHQKVKPAIRIRRRRRCVTPYAAASREMQMLINII